VLGAQALARPRALAAWRDDLRQAGWAGLALAGLTAELLGLIAPAAIPDGTMLLLRWSPALADRAPAMALRGLDPGRLVLTGCDAGGEAIAWGLRRGVSLFTGRDLQGPGRDGMPA
jgi:hypothetical protein